MEFLNHLILILILLMKEETCGREVSSQQDDFNQSHEVIAFRISHPNTVSSCHDCSLSPAQAESAPWI